MPTFRGGTRSTSAPIRSSLGWPSLLSPPARVCTSNEARVRCPGCVAESGRRFVPQVDQLWATATSMLTAGPQRVDPAGRHRALGPRRPSQSAALPAEAGRTLRIELFLVPTFAAGRAVGLGQEASEEWNAPAWTTTGDPTDLPYYFRSRFVTSAMEDFELQVRRLRPAPADGIPGLGDARLGVRGRPRVLPRLLRRRPDVPCPDCAAAARHEVARIRHRPSAGHPLGLDAKPGHRRRIGDPGRPQRSGPAGGNAPIWLAVPSGELRRHFAGRRFRLVSPAESRPQAPPGGGSGGRKPSAAIRRT